MPTEPNVAAYGAWPSPITAVSLVTGAVGINEVRADPVDTGLVWWAESRPDEGGRTAVMRADSLGRVEVTAPGANVRTLVHEYGGGAWWPHDGVLFFVDFADQRLRRLDPDGAVTELTRRLPRRGDCATPTAGSPPTASGPCVYANATTRATSRPTRSWRSPTTARWS